MSKGGFFTWRSPFRWLGRTDAFGAEALDQLEADLLGADVGLPTTLKLLSVVEKACKKRSLRFTDVMHLLRQEVLAMCSGLALPFSPNAGAERQRLVVLVGVNGVGKTTTAAKLAYRYQQEAKRVLFGACDTFRAAATDQLRAWGERLGIDGVFRARGTDAASVAFEAAQKAQQESYDVLIIDTAGRLHTKQHLMDELAKIQRVLTKALPHALHETLWVLDATHGQNGLAQAQVFQEAVSVTAAVLSKLDGTSKGGLLLPIMDQMKLPVWYLGVGEAPEALAELNLADYLNQLFGNAVSDNAN